MNFDLEKCTVDELAEHFQLIQGHIIAFLNKGELASATISVQSMETIVMEVFNRLRERT